MENMDTDVRVERVKSAQMKTLAIKQMFDQLEWKSKSQSDVKLDQGQST